MSIDRLFVFLLAALFPFCVSVCLGDDVPRPDSTEGKADSTVHDDRLRHGDAVYSNRCASCHGANGEGVEDFHSDPLFGDLSIGALSEFISETMPDDDPEACVGEDAAAVAAFIHHAFYSEAARNRSRPARIGLARLTAAQLRQSLADLYARSGGVIWAVKNHGLQGLYFDGARLKNDNKRIERVDPVLDFDFGHAGPGEGINPEDFYIQWRGAIHADTTGEYDIIIRSTCSFVCFIGTEQREFINNHVQSGDKTEFHRSVVLTAGRVYPIKIDFFQRKRKTEQPPARFSLSWKPPHGTERIIPQRHLLDVVAPPAFSLQTKLPPDDRSYGYERGTTVDRQWDESTTNSAIEFAQIAADELWPQYRRQHGRDSGKNRAQLRGFLTEIVATAFRGPLDEGVRKLYVDDQVDAVDDDAEAIKRALLISLKSPRFLYPLLDADRSASERAANRLALTLFDSLPSDSWLVAQIRSDELASEEQIRVAARRMVFDYRTKAKTRELLYEWLNLSNVDEITKDAQAFAGFDAELVSDLRASLNAFLDDVVWSESSDYRKLFRADWTYTTGRLAEFYGDAWNPVGTEAHVLQRSVSDPKHRAGLLSHPYLMSKLAYHDTSSPIHRGVFLIRSILGRVLHPPEEAFVPLAPDLHPDLTTRERVELQTSPENCQACHAQINGLGFTLENYDAVGRYRDTEKQRPINVAGSYTTRSNQEIEISGPRDLADFLATSDDSHRAFVRRAFQHFVKQPAAAYGPETLNQLTESFKENGYSIRELLIEIAVIAATEVQSPEETGESERPDEPDESNEQDD